MSLRRTVALCFTTVVALCLAGLLAAPAVAVPSSTQTAEDRAAVERAVKRYDEAQARSAEIDARIAEASAELDAIVAEERLASEALRVQVARMYRSPDVDFISVLLGASTFEEFIELWDSLARIAAQDAENLQSLKDARAQLEVSAQQLMSLQAEAAQALDDVAAEVARAKKDLAASEAALKEYEARMAAKAAAAAAARAAAAAKPPASDPNQQLMGSGDWQTGVASHYGRNFTGRAASGETIGPYSMIVAHKTLPVGTLIELEYNGKRAVARVADRGPFVTGRDFDLGPGVVRVLDFSGVHEVRFRIVQQ
jgi:rare lipoprotein A (peptidoglycan hydrolase)